MSIYPVQDIWLTPETNRINSGKTFCIVSDSHTYHFISEDSHKSVCVFCLNMCILSEHVEHSNRFMKTPNANYQKPAKHYCKSQIINFWCELYVPQGDKQTTLHYITAAILFVCAEVLWPCQQLWSCQAGQLTINTVPGQALTY